jgi:hypothetical protein
MYVCMYVQQSDSNDMNMDKDYDNMLEGQLCHTIYSLRIIHLPLQHAFGRLHLRPLSNSIEHTFLTA